MLDQIRPHGLKVESYRIQIAIRYSRQKRQFSVGLSSEEKKKIHTAAVRIRVLIENSDLDDGKKNALYDKLNIFLAEVDSSRTRFDRSLSAIIEIADVANQAGKKMPGLGDFILRIAEIFGGSKKSEAPIAQIKPPEPVRRLEAPTRSTGPKKAYDMDDEIPF